MKKIYSLFLVFILLSFSSVFALISHPASQIEPGSFQLGDYTMPNGQLFVNYSSTSQPAIVASSASHAQILIASSNLTKSDNIYFNAIPSNLNRTYIGFTESIGIFGIVHDAAIGGIQMTTDDTNPNNIFYMNKNGKIGIGTDPTGLKQLSVNEGIGINIANGNYDSYFKDDNGSYQLYMDASTGNIGIGTSDPEFQLHMVGTTGNGMKIERPPYGNLTLSVADSTNSYIFSTGDLHLSANSSQISQLVLDQSGKVGIGINSPSELLHVEKSSTGDDVTIRVDNDDNTNSASHARFYAQTGGPSGGDPLIAFGVNGQTPVWSIGTDNSDSRKLKISDTGTVGSGTIMTFEASNDRVGIGTNSPDTLLEVQSATATAARVRVEETGTSGSNHPGYQIYNEGSFEGALTYNEAGDFVGVWTGYDSSNPLLKMPGGSQNVGIGLGANSPQTHLDVDGVIRTRPRSTATCNANAEGGIYYDSDDDHFYGCTTAGWVRLDTTYS